MGLFDFAGNIGKKIFGSEEEAPEQLKQHVEEDNPGVENLDIQVQDGVATVSGDAASPEAMEKTVLMVGNAMGIEEVKADELTVGGEPVQEAPADDQFYTIESGDSLWKIAERVYGNGAKYQQIVEANREVIKDADLIFPGQKIRIPSDV